MWVKLWLPWLQVYEVLADLEEALDESFSCPWFRNTSQYNVTMFKHPNSSHHYQRNYEIHINLGLEFRSQRVFGRGKVDKSHPWHGMGVFFYKSKGVQWEHRMEFKSGRILLSLNRLCCFRPVGGQVQWYHPWWGYLQFLYLYYTIPIPIPLSRTDHCSMLESNKQGKAIQTNFQI